ncbi:hypothetical protein CDL12_17604 [Handroanthus impetiginosus]|nr:hypothetical protein CDL12_17604 [Handroanthus impetiginosus]
MVHSSVAITSLKLTCSFPSTSTSDSHRSFSFTTRSLRLSRFKILSRIDDGSADQFLQNNTIADFMRFKRDNNAKLQTAVVSYRKKFPWSLLKPFLQVDLVSTIHIADKE